MLSILINRMISYLGSGQFGDVKKAIWTKNDHQKLDVAVKTLKKHAVTDERVKFLQEAATMGQFSHSNVVKLHGVVLEKEASVSCSQRYWQLVTNGIECRKVVDSDIDHT